MVKDPGKVIKMRDDTRKEISNIKGSRTTQDHKSPSHKGTTEQHKSPPKKQK
jgi:hypothetical protein